MKNNFTALSLIIFIAAACQPKSGEKVETVKKYVVAPFTGLDSIAVNDWWNRKPNEIIDVKVGRDSVIAFGAYTVANNTLKLTAQLFPLYPDEPKFVFLDIEEAGEWKEIQRQPVYELGWSAHFRVENWQKNEDVAYRLRHGQSATFEGTVRKLPLDKQEIVIAALSCNSNKGPDDRDSYVKNINALDPDMVFFAGDQSYHHREHTAAWLLFGRQFRETFRHRPMIAIPDDHDIGQGNLWGDGGTQAPSMAGHDGG